MNKILEIKNLKKKFADLYAVDEISFSIDQGTCFGLLGPNGAGKTTTIEMIEGILTPDSGEILYKGLKRGKKFKEEIGIQLQNTELPLFLTVKETLKTFRDLYENQSDLSDLTNICELHDILNRDNRKISGGQKQRLLFAIALANDPDLIFLDEPTTGLDPQARRHLWDIVGQLKADNKTIILTTHYMEEAQLLCDKVAIMDKGKILVMDKPSILLEKYCNGASIELPDLSLKDKLNGFPYKIFKSQNRIEIHTDSINECIKALLKREIDLSDITIRSQNLEDLFLKLTGNLLRS